jgi:rubrerythrin
MGFLLPSLLGPLLGGLFSHNSMGGGSLEAAASEMNAEEEGDEVTSLATQQAVSARSTKMANIIMVADEHTRETSMYNEFALSVKDAEEKTLTKEMKLVDDASSA